MARARKVVGYFFGSPQAVLKLLNAQRCGMIKMYEGKEPVNMSQGVVTRWWAIWQMLVSLRWLRAAITMLHATGEIDCVLLTKEQ